MKDAEDGQNSETSPGDLRRLAVTQTPAKKLSANTDVKNSRGVNNNNNNNNNNNSNNNNNNNNKKKKKKKKKKN